METFRVRVVPGTDGICTLMLSGEFDLAVVEDVIALGTASLNDATTQTLILDLAALTFADSSALGAMIRLRNIAARQDKRMMLAHVPPKIVRLLHLAGLDDVFATIVG